MPTNGSTTPKNELFWRKNSLYCFYTAVKRRYPLVDGERRASRRNLYDSGCGRSLLWTTGSVSDRGAGVSPAEGQRDGHRHTVLSYVLTAATASAILMETRGGMDMSGGERLRVSQHSGRSGSAKHNDRSFLRDGTHRGKRGVDVERADRRRSSGASMVHRDVSGRFGAD